MGPGPRQGSGIHRYVFLLYQSTEPIREPTMFDDIQHRRRFPLKDFVEKILI